MKRKTKRGLSARRTRGPSPQKTAATRQALVEAGLAAFLTHGYSAARMNDIAADAGMAKGTIYLHFTDKQALFEGAMHEWLRQTIGGQLPPRPLLGEPTRDFLLRTVVPLLRELQSNDRFGMLYLVLTEGPRFPDIAQTYRAVVIEPGLRLVRLYAARAERRGELRTTSVSRHPMLLVAPAILSAIWNHLFSRGEALDVAAVFESYLDLIFGHPDL